MSLPVEAVRERLLAEVERRPVALSSPTGSGKSTQVPRWLPGTVWVIEPRRVACQSLARRVAELEGTALGDGVGYQVRDDARAGARTRVLFVTPGVALRRLSDLLAADAIVLDELHERHLEVDLLLALLRERYRGRLVVMSATIEGGRVADHLGGVHLSVDVRSFPVDVCYRPGGVLLPDRKGLVPRVLSALDEALEVEGDVLVFLPGKAEIAELEEALRGRRDLSPVPLHGGLALAEQARAFEPTKARKVILATNVAETSLTIPGVRVVIDTGLVRRTRYHEGRAYLALVPVAMDGADQRAGRAGRTAPGRCFRLWDEKARLEPHTPPAIHRESLSPLLLAASAVGARFESLVFLDAPKPYAVDEAKRDLLALGAIAEDGSITGAGRELFGLPLDPALGRLLVEARLRGTLDDAIDVAAALAVGRPLFTSAATGDDDLREPGCDAVALVRAVREGDARAHGLSSFALAEARETRRRLRAAFGLADAPPAAAPVDRKALALTALAADPRTAHVARRRKGELAFANGGTEIELARESAAARKDEPEALVVLETRALGRGGRDARILATCAMPVPLAWLVEAGLGRDRVAGATLEKGTLLARVERVYARKVLATREEIPSGALAREAIAELAVRGTLFREAMAVARERLAAQALAASLRGSRVAEELGLSDLPEPPPELRAFVEARLLSLGLERADDLALLSPEDLLPEELPFHLRSVLDRELPRVVDLGDCRYEAEYDVEGRRVLLRIARGQRSKPPPRSFLPRFPGFRVYAEAGKTLHLVE